MPERCVSVLLVGARAVGKNVFLTRHTRGEFEYMYQPTGYQTDGFFNSSLVSFCQVPSIDGSLQMCDLGADCTGPDHYRTNFSVVTACSLEEISAFRSIPDYIILMFDVTNRLSYNVIPMYKEHLHYTFGKVRMIVVGNKVDVSPRVVKASEISKQGMQYYDLSAKSCYNYERPFTWYLKQVPFQQEAPQKAVQKCGTRAEILSMASRAMKQGHNAVADWLLQHEFAECKDNCMCAALTLAAQNGHTELVQYIASHTQTPKVGNAGSQREPMLPSAAPHLP